MLQGFRFLAGRRTLPEPARHIPVDGLPIDEL